MTDTPKAPDRIWILPPYYTVNGIVPDISFEPVWDKGKPQAFGEPRLDAAEYLARDGETVAALVEALRVAISYAWPSDAWVSQASAALAKITDN